VSVAFCSWSFCVLDYPVLLLFPAALAYAAVMDVFTMTIPNRISLAILAMFPIAALLAGLSMHAALMHLAAFAVILAFGIALFAFNLLGGGDAKLLAVSALWIGTDQLIPFIAYVTVAGGALALMILAVRSIPAGAYQLPEWAARLHKAGNGIPYGLAICAGGLFVYPKTALFKLLIV
jgi:prepilin peptidase CpaA